MFKNEKNEFEQEDYTGSNRDTFENRQGDFVFDHYGRNARYIGEGGDVAIPEQIKPDSLTYIFETTKNIRSLHYPSCVKTIWADSLKPSYFGSTGTLEKIIFSDGLVSIKGSGFASDCKKLRDVFLPDSLEYLGTSAFKNTPWYKENVEIVDGCHYLGRFLVSSDRDIVRASVRKGTVMVCGFAFKARTSLIAVSISETVKIIGDQAFNGCTALKEIRLPESVNRIEASCFSGCSSLTRFEALNKDITISSNAFGSKLSKEIYYPEYAYIPAVIGGKGIEKLFFGYCYLTSRERYTPELQATNDAIVKKINTKLLDLIINRKNIQALRNIAPISISKNNIDSVLESVQRNGNPEMTAFLLEWKKNEVGYNNSPQRLSVKELNKDPYSVTEMKKVWTTKKLKVGTLAITSYKGTDLEVNIPSHIGKTAVTAIDREAFMAKTYSPIGKKISEEQVEIRKQIHTVRIPEGVKSIGIEAFGYCEGLQSVFIPQSVIKIDGMAFLGCSKLTIYGYSKSYAEKYTTKEKIHFEPIKEKG